MSKPSDQKPTATSELPADQKAATTSVPPGEHPATELTDQDLDKVSAGSMFEVASFSFDIEQTLNIGSQSSGAGAGKVTFNPFTVKGK